MSARAPVPSSPAFEPLVRQRRFELEAPALAPPGVIAA
jgi:hypothetical protein